MGAPVMTVGSTVMCAHAGKVTLAPGPRVTINGEPVVLQSIPSVVAGCTLPPPPVNIGPCVTVSWLSATTRVKVMGQPILLQSSSSLAAPTGNPASVVKVQSKVTAT